MRFLTANYRTPRGEIDLVFRDRNCLVFVEVKTRSEDTRTRPALAVDLRKRQRISRAAETYLRQIEAARIVWRFDVVEVLLKNETVSQIQHLRNVFELHPRRSGRRRGYRASD
jgi:putative endonuclease